MRNTVSFSYLKSINNELKCRYNEVELMIMYAAASFYDSAGNLVEHYLKYISQIKKVKVEKTDSHGKLFNRLTPYFLDELGLDENTYNKIKRLSQSINSHKHYRYLETTKYDLVKYLNNFFNLYALASKDYNKDFNEYFDKQYFDDLYGLLSPKSLINIFRSVRLEEKEIAEEISKQQLEIDNKLKALGSLQNIKII